MLTTPESLKSAMSNPAKLLEMVNIQAEDSSSCKQELGNLTEEEALLFLKLVKLCKDPNAINQFTISESVIREPTTKESSAGDSDTSSVENCQEAV